MVAPDALAFAALDYRATTGIDSAARNQFSRLSRVNV